MALSEKYRKILNAERPTKKDGIPMSRHDRAAQFAPFAALTGYEDEVEKTAQAVTDRVLQMEENVELIID